jgi:hypothetical protein
MQKLNNKGYILVQVIIFGAVAVYLILGLVSWANLNLKAAKHTYNNELAMQIAEAGAEYYRWHLSHDPYDYQDGTGAPGPYVHNFLDGDGEVIGQYELNITPPVLGSTFVKITSKGTINADPNISRTVETILARPSFAKYVDLTNFLISYGGGAEVFGRIHSNKGVMFDGLAHNLVTSAVTEIDDPFHGGGNEWGVHTHVPPVDLLPPTPLSIRTDVFESGREVGVPVVDFESISGNLAEIKTGAQEDGFYRASSGAQGYHIVFKTDDTFDLYLVDSFVSPINDCDAFSSSQEGWSTWSIETESLLGNFPNPNNGLIFIEDNVFVDGKIDSARLTVATAVFPDSPVNRKSIIVNNDLLYTNYDGQDVIGLIAQKDIIIGMVSDDYLEIQGVLIAQNGRFIRFYYPESGGGFSRCEPHQVKDTLSLYGSNSSNLEGWLYYGNPPYPGESGYLNYISIYDANLLYSPPPYFPITSDQYETLYWGEAK